MQNHERDKSIAFIKEQPITKAHWWTSMQSRGGKPKGEKENALDLIIARIFCDQK